MRASYTSERMPHDCPVCGFTLRDMSDTVSYEQYECCTDCQNEFVFRNRQAWEEGKRPSPREIEAFRQKLLTRASYLLG